MNNCIFTSHCTELTCDKSCPTLAETSYLLERNGIKMDSFVFSSTEFNVDSILNLLESHEGELVTVQSSSTIHCAEMLTYCAICQNWRGNRLHCNVYHLRYSKYLEDLKKSWGLKQEPEDLEYTKIWSEGSKVLIISNMDYVNFGDFESQTLLNLIQSRQANNATTILVVPSDSNLHGKTDSTFFNVLKQLINKDKVRLSSSSKAVTK